MWRRRIFAKKPLEALLAEMEVEQRLHRVLGPVSLSALGIGAIVGASANERECHAIALRAMT